jgi:ABC-type nitrate/sulfonate/bicarbonate transport system substrate-binding protein
MPVTESGRQIRLGCFSVPAVSRVAEATGIYSAHRVDVLEKPVASSADQFRRLLDGDLDVLLTSPDNVLTYRVNPSNPLGRLADVRILRAVDWGLGLSLLATPDYPTVESLRGHRIGADIPTSGFAYALVAILAQHGLGTGDYELVTLGSTPRRAAALAVGACDATLLNAGHDVQAEQSGSIRLARVSSSLGGYLGAVLAAQPEWLDQNTDLARDFIAAWDAAVARTLDPASRALVEAELSRGLLAASDVTAETYRTLVSTDEGLVPDGSVDPAAWARIVEMRALAGGFDVRVDVDAVRAEPPLAATATY